jgi:hypothetical protein
LRRDPASPYFKHHFSSLCSSRYALRRAVRTTGICRDSIRSGNKNILSRSLWLVFVKRERKDNGGKRAGISDVKFLKDSSIIRIFQFISPKRS